ARRRPAAGSPGGAACRRAIRRRRARGSRSPAPSPSRGRASRRARRALPASAASTARTLRGTRTTRRSTPRAARPLCDRSLLAALAESHLFDVEIHRRADDVERALARVELVHLAQLLLEDLVVLEEARQLLH